MRDVVLYGRKGCHLCDLALGAVRAARAQIEFSLREVDIDGDPDLKADYGHDVPVIEIDGRRAFRLRVDAAALVERLRR